jgi:hypothetical protein
MLIQILAHQPQMLGTIVSRTPVWVWGLLAALLTLGLSQAIGRPMSLRRLTLTPAGMTAFSAWGTVNAFGGSPQFAQVMLVWAGAAAAMFALVAPLSPPAGTRYHPATRSFDVPGSWIPLALILGIFLVKYVVGVELAMQPALARDTQYTLVAGALYGGFSGIFIGRAARLWRLALRPASVSPILSA